MLQITNKNNTANGMSIKVVSVAEVMNSRRVSNSRKELAMEPIGPLRERSSMSITCSNKESAITMSACAPATSKK